jgi:glucokinase
MKNKSLLSLLGLFILTNVALINKNVEANDDAWYTSVKNAIFAEKYAAATALVYDTKIAMQNEPDSLLWQICPDIDKVNAKTAFDAKELGDEVARKVIDTYIEYLACGIINVINIFQPEVLCLGGGVSNQQETLLKPIKEYIDREDYARNIYNRTELKIATFRNDAGIIGAALIGVK